MSDGAARSSQHKRRSACSVPRVHENLPEHSVFRHKIIRCRLNEPQDCSKPVRLRALSRASIRSMRGRNIAHEPSSKAGGAMVAPATGIMHFRKRRRPSCRSRFACLPARARSIAGLCQWQHPMLSLTQGRARWLPANVGQRLRRLHANLLARQRVPPRALLPLDRDPLLRRAPSRQSPRHRKQPRRLLPNKKRCSRCFEKRRAPLSPPS
jgi:hypothetical protein